MKYTLSLSFLMGCTNLFTMNIDTQEIVPGAALYEIGSDGNTTFYDSSGRNQLTRRPTASKTDLEKMLDPSAGKLQAWHYKITLESASCCLPSRKRKRIMFYDALLNELGSYKYNRNKMTITYYTKHNKKTFKFLIDRVPNDFPFTFQNASLREMN